jgi:hypothetical protein
MSGLWHKPGARGWITISVAQAPTQADTDGDGFNDGFEVAQGSDPTDPLSIPVGGSLPAIPPAGLLLLVVVLLAVGRAATSPPRYAVRRNPAK